MENPLFGRHIHDSKSIELYRESAAGSTLIQNRYSLRDSSVSSTIAVE